MFTHIKFDIETDHGPVSVHTTVETYGEDTAEVISRQKEEIYKALGKPANVAWLEEQRMKNALNTDLPLSPQQRLELAQKKCGTKDATE